MKGSILRKIHKPNTNYKRKVPSQRLPVNPNREYLYGIMPIQLALQANKRKMYNLYLKTDYGKEKDRYDSCSGNKVTFAYNLP